MEWIHFGDKQDSILVSPREEEKEEQMTESFMGEKDTHCSNWTPVGLSHGISSNSIMTSTIYFSLRMYFLLIRFRTSRPWDKTKDDEDTRQGLYINECNINILHNADNTWIPVAEEKERKREKYRYGRKVARQTNKQVLQKWRVWQMGRQKNRD